LANKIGIIWTFIYKSLILNFIKYIKNTNLLYNIYLFLNILIFSIYFFL
jgi:hypothetical protein